MEATVQEIECIHGEKGPMTRVGVFEGDPFGPTTQIGEYTRNMEGTGPFQVFHQDGKAYALYNPNYTTTSVMSLSDCKLIASEPEDPHGIGYIPMEFHVPCSPQEKALDLKISYVDHVNGRWGVISGCYWGAEWYSPIQYLDLSRIHEGVVTRDDRFGGLQKPRHLPLSACLDLWDYTESNPILKVVRATPCNLHQNLEVEPTEEAEELLRTLEGKTHVDRVKVLETRIRQLLRWEMKR